MLASYFIAHRFTYKGDDSNEKRNILERWTCFGMKKATEAWIKFALLLFLSSSNVHKLHTSSPHLRSMFIHKVNVWSGKNGKVRTEQRVPMPAHSLRWFFLSLSWLLYFLLHKTCCIYLYIISVVIPGGVFLFAVSMHCQFL